MEENKKIVIAQFFTTNLSYGKFTKEINKKYCDEKGYIYHLESDNNKIKTALEGRSPTWYKPKFINEVFELYNPDYILFLDADAIVCDFSYKVEDFIDSDYNIICTEDYGPSKLNAGVFIMKNSDWTKRVMNKWWETGNNLVGGPNNEMGFYKTGLWHDQTCFGHLMDIMPDSKTNIKLITNKVLNGREYKNNVDKNFIFHAFSYGMLPNRTIDKCYYDIFNIEIPDGEKLSDIVEYYDTDKHYEHNYLRLIYDDLFLPIRDEVKTFVEIGVNHGGSILMWRDYFKNSKVLGLDNNLPFCEEKLRDKNLDRIELINLDQSIPEMLETFANQYSDIDVILEDGSHRMHDQQITLAKLFKTLKSGGIYVLEDLHTSLEAPMPEKAWCGWGDSTKTLTLDMLNNFISTGKIQSDYLTEDEINYLNDNILSVEIYQNRPDWSITSVIIKK
jgi:hypothetical protein